MTLPILSALERQRVLDASLPLQLLRARLCDASRPAGVQLEAYPVESPEVQNRVRELGDQAHELVSVSHPATYPLATYRQSLRYTNRRSSVACP